MQEATFYHGLNLAAKGEYKTLHKIISKCKGDSWEERFRTTRGRLALSEKEDSETLEKEWAALQRAGIGLTLASALDHPPLLRHIPHQPFGLYFRGDPTAARADKSNAGMSVAIVGTRKAGGSGLALARKFASTLASAGCTIISGLAFGIDAAAHAGALEAGGRTAAVLANGLDRIYPSSNRELAARILASGGALLSEYPPGSPPLAHRFLERNRIISGLAEAVLIVEAPERSGALATARFALEQNRDIFVTPGAADNLKYRGSHGLIRSGAMLVSTPEEMLEDLGLAGSENPAKSGEKGAADTPEEARILEVLAAAGRSLTIDEIIETATLTSSIVNITMTMLTLKNAVWEEDGRYRMK